MDENKVSIISKEGKLKEVDISDIDFNKLIFCCLYPIEQPEQCGYVEAEDVDSAIIIFFKYMDNYNIPYSNLHTINARKCKKKDEIKCMRNTMNMQLYSWKRNPTICVREIGFVRALNEDHAVEILKDHGHTFGTRISDTIIRKVDISLEYGVIDEYQL